MTEWQWCGASVVGSRHRTEGVPCQDALSFFLGDDWIVGVVADGAGSAPRGGEGAALITEACVSQANDLFSSFGFAANTSGLRTTLYRLLARIRSAADAHAAKTGAPLSEFASTIAVVVAGRSLFGAIHVGDGAIVVKRRQGTLEQIAAPDQPEFVNQTTFLTSLAWRSAAACHVEDHSDVTAVAMLTDGLVPVATVRPSGSPHGPFFEPLFAFAASPDADAAELGVFLASARVAKATGDDVTLLLARRNGR